MAWFCIGFRFGFSIEIFGFGFINESSSGLGFGFGFGFSSNLWSQTTVPDLKGILFFSIFRSKLPPEAANTKFLEGMLLIAQTRQAWEISCEVRNKDH